MILGANIGDRGIRQREFGVQHHRVFEHLERKLQILPREPSRIAPSAQIQIVSLEIFRRLRGDRFLLLGRQSDPQRLCNLSRDLVLHFKDVLHFAVITLRPQRKIRVRIHKLRVDPQTVPGAPQAPG